MKTKKNNSFVNQKLIKGFFIFLIFLSLFFILNINDHVKAEDANPTYEGPSLGGGDEPDTIGVEEKYDITDDITQRIESGAYNPGDNSEGGPAVKGGGGNGRGSHHGDNDDREKCYCDACVGGCSPGCRQKVFYEDDCLCVDDCSECGGPSPEEEEKCEYENPNPAEKQVCSNKCKSSCQDMWHEGNSCTYTNWWEFWTLWKKHNGNFCCPDTCDDLDGYTCEEGEVCPDDWLSPLTGETKCCSVPCVKPCGYSEDSESSATGLIYIEELGLDEEELAHDADIGMETNAVQEVIKAGGVAVCADECTDLKYTVEDSCDSSDEWCKNCVSSTGSHCCVYCPPKTVYEEGKGCVKPSCDSCEKITGLPYNEEDDNKDYLDTGYSICKEECEDIDLGDGVIWKAYSPSEGDKWCSQINGGTDFENATKCCAYCPPETHYSPITKLCEQELNETNLIVELNCPIVKLSWKKYDGASSYQIIPFYDEDNDKEEDGKCEEDELDTKRNYFYYILKSSKCADHYTSNLRFQIIPQYPDKITMESEETEWIDVSECDIKAFCSDGTTYNECSDEKPFFCDKGELIKNCSVCDCPEGEYTCLDNGSCSLQS